MDGRAPARARCRPPRLRGIPETVSGTEYWVAVGQIKEPWKQVCVAHRGPITEPLSTVTSGLGGSPLSAFTHRSHEWRNVVPVHRYVRVDNLAGAKREHCTVRDPEHRPVRKGSRPNLVPRDRFIGVDNDLDLLLAKVRDHVNHLGGRLALDFDHFTTVHQPVARDGRIVSEHKVVGPQRSQLDMKAQHILSVPKSVSDRRSIFFHPRHYVEPPIARSPAQYPTR